MDLIKKYNCILDFNQDYNCLVLRLFNIPQPIEIPIINNNSFILPPRLEVIRKVDFIDCNDEIVIPNQELERGAFIANTLVKSNQAYIRILNTNNTITTVNNGNMKTENR